MKKNIIISLIVLSFFSLQNCSTLKEGFTSQKKNSVDEFLVEKKSPLVMPPEFGELPIPNEVKKDNNDEADMKSLLSSDTKNSSTENKGSQKQSTLEGSILEKIKN